MCSFSLVRPLTDSNLNLSPKKTINLAGQIYFYTFPSLDLVVAIKPIRNVITFAVDSDHLQRPFSPERGTRVEPVEFSVIKARSVALFNLRNDRLIYQKVCYYILSLPIIFLVLK